MGRYDLTKKYITKSFAPITDKQEAIYALLQLKSQLMSQTTSVPENKNKI